MRGANSTTDYFQSALIRQPNNGIYLGSLIFKFNKSQNIFLKNSATQPTGIMQRYRNCNEKSEKIFNLMVVCRQLERSDRGNSQIMLCFGSKNKMTRTTGSISWISIGSLRGSRRICGRPELLAA